MRIRWTAWLTGVVFMMACIGEGGGNETDDEDDAAEGRSAGDCSDGADNDSDGDFDCNDTGCAGAPACSAGTTASGSGGGQASCPVVEGSYEVWLDTSASTGDCEGDVGSNFVCMVSQDGCSATATCQVMGMDVALAGELKPRGGNNTHGYSGSTTVFGSAVSYDIEFRCDLTATSLCEYLSQAVVSVSIPAARLQCVFQGALL